jgi:hypothetical protein
MMKNTMNVMLKSTSDSVKMDYTKVNR